MSDRRFALVAGGGTGGHLVPALAVARALRTGLAPDAVELVGSRRGLDAELLADAALPVTLLPGRGLRRRLDPASLASNVAAVAALAAALAMALALVGRRRPAVVVAMGGYASVPVALAAVAWRVPVVLVNVDAVPGAANRLVGRFAAAAAVAFAGTPLRNAVVTGAPVRPEIAAAANPSEEDRFTARRRLGLPEHATVVAAVGGSLGAERINRAVLDLAARWGSSRSDVVLYHVVGRRDWPWAAEAGATLVGALYRQVAYESNMDLFYRAADVVVCRAGANTVAELAVVGAASVLVPLPGAPGDHQTRNALALVEAGAAVLLPDERCTGEELASVLEPLLAEPERLKAMRAAAAELGRPDAVEAVAAVVRAHAKRREP
ncbi:MAG: UDP-N-acetylglucosamine--N-acetylmuramyl-(pentapeptide) pyrophosphoryl-undecaprenol N-acetylglucosamine transferase [Acidimicrobiales bacterium]